MKDILKKIVIKTYKIVFTILTKVLPQNKELIIFESYLGKQYSDNPRAIYEYLLKHNPEYKMYWSVDGSFKRNKHPHLDTICRFSLKWLYLMPRAGYWVTNSRLPTWLPKPKKTIYVQTWHGTPLKRLAGDMEDVHMPGTNIVEYKQNFFKEVQKWDYLLSPNSYSTKIFQRAFQFDKKVIESGYPRNDYLISNNNKETILKIKKENNIPLDKKVVLYAPTWRDNQYYKVGKYKFDLKLDINKLRSELKDEYIIILRLHYLISDRLDIAEDEGFVFDYSDHEDIRELYLISDLLITDYSSVFFDYANLKRPMLFYVYDIDDYRDKLRGFYFDFELQAPGPLVKETDEIISEIKKITKNEFQPLSKTLDFYNKYCYLEDGQASERVVKTIFRT